MVLITCPSCETQVWCFLCTSPSLWKHNTVLRLLHGYNSSVSHRKPCGHISPWNSSLSIWPEKYGKLLCAAARGTIIIFESSGNDALISKKREIILQLNHCYKAGRWYWWLVRDCQMLLICTCSFFFFKMEATGIVIGHFGKIIVAVWQ